LTPLSCNFPYTTLFRSQGLAREQGDFALVPAVDDPEFAGAAHLVGEAHAARAENAARAPIFDMRAHGRLGLDHLLFVEAAMVAAVGIAVVLQAAFAGLIAFGAVEGMVDEEELHHRLAGLLHVLALGGDFHVLGYGLGAGYHGAGRSLDPHHADAAIARDRQIRMV